MKSGLQARKYPFFIAHFVQLGFSMQIVEHLVMNWNLVAHIIIMIVS